MSSDSVCRQTVKVNLENGLHLVPCSKIAKTVRNFECVVYVHKENRAVDAKNVLDLMTLDAAKGTELVLEANGNRAAEVMALLVRMFESDFDE